MPKHVVTFRTASGQREYGPGEIARVRVIRDLLALGLTIEDLRFPARTTGLPATQSSCPGSRTTRAPGTAFSRKRHRNAGRPQT
ncbi:MerR family transcriptional regulator [Streptomyces avermitilis]|uniref:MerR family transcriptional regulator n=2 Tax=Streptomyces avermitilis TaxID=33903 RepID=UPI0036AD8A66